MSHRRESIQNDSFDLFLDTICNTFGGIVFLAILLAIMIQTRAIVKAPEQRDESPISADEVRELVTQLDDAVSTRAALVQTLESMPLAEEQSDNAEFVELSMQYKTANQKLSDVIVQQVKQTRLLAEQLASNSQLAAENASIPLDLDKIRTKVSDGEHELKNLIGQRQTTLRLPRERRSNASAQLVLVQKSKVFVAGRPFGLSPDLSSEQVDSNTSFGGGHVVTPRFGKGWDPGDPDVVNMIANARRQGNVLTIAIWPDSFGEFHKLKELMIQSSVPYQLWPQNTGETLTVYFGAQGSRVQ